MFGRPYGNLISMGRLGGWTRFAVILGVGMVLSFVLRAAGAGLLFPLAMPAVVLTAGYFSMKADQPRRCPTCDLRLAYRDLGGGRGMFECPSLCGYRIMVAKGNRRRP